MDLEVTRLPETDVTWLAPSRELTRGQRPPADRTQGANGQGGADSERRLNDASASLASFCDM